MLWMFRAWFEQDMSVEAIQAFCCLTYWQEPGDSVCLLLIHSQTYHLFSHVFRNFRKVGRTLAMYVLILKAAQGY